jgi:hypothetical protein
MILFQLFEVVFVFVVVLVLHAQFVLGENNGNQTHYVCTKAERASGHCRWCNRDFPSVGGTWVDKPPYWQYPGECKNQAFDVSHTISCMRQRTLYVIGNSVARQAAFDMIEMLGGTPLNRTDQQQACPKAAKTWGDSCRNEYAGVKIRYLYLQFMNGVDYNDIGGFPFFRYEDKITKGWTTGKIPKSSSNQHFNRPHDLVKDLDIQHVDNCIHTDTRSCLATFFAGAQPTDVLVFALGMVYPVHGPGVEPARNTIGIDYSLWALHSAVAFKSHLQATFPGQVFRFTHAPLGPDPKSVVKSPNLDRTNKLLWTVWAPALEDKPWYTIDQWKINTGRFSLYNDNVHFSGPLTRAMLTQVLNELCPGGGVSVE